MLFYPIIAYKPTETTYTDTEKLIKIYTEKFRYKLTPPEQITFNSVEIIFFNAYSQEEICRYTLTGISDFEDDIIIDFSSILELQDKTIRYYWFPNINYTFIDSAGNSHTGSTSDDSAFLQSLGIEESTNSTIVKRFDIFQYFDDNANVYNLPTKSKLYPLLSTLEIDYFSPNIKSTIYGNFVYDSVCFVSSNFRQYYTANSINKPTSETSSLYIYTKQNSWDSTNNLTNILLDREYSDLVFVDLIDRDQIPYFDSFEADNQNVNIWVVYKRPLANEYILYQRYSGNHIRLQTSSTNILKIVGIVKASSDSITAFIFYQNAANELCYLHCDIDNNILGENDNSYKLTLPYTPSSSSHFNIQRINDNIVISHNDQNNYCITICSKNNTNLNIIKNTSVGSLELSTTNYNFPVGSFASQSMYSSGKYISMFVYTQYGYVNVSFIYINGDTVTKYTLNNTSDLSFDGTSVPTFREINNKIYCFYARYVFYFDLNESYIGFYHNNIYDYLQTDTSPKTTMFHNEFCSEKTSLSYIYYIIPYTKTSRNFIGMIKKQFIV